MSAVRNKNTRPELIVRKYLFARGFRYRLNCKRLPGNPDIVLKKYRAAIFVNGCFWHGHEGCRKAALPNTHFEFWKEKIERNKVRDARNMEELEHMGWRCIVIWQCELERYTQEETLLSLVHKIRSGH